MQQRDWAPSLYARKTKMTACLKLTSAKREDECRNIVSNEDVTNLSHASETTRAPTSPSIARQNPEPATPRKKHCAAAFTQRDCSMLLDYPRQPQVCSVDVLRTKDSPIDAKCTTDIIQDAGEDPSIRAAHVRVFLQSKAQACNAISLVRCEALPASSSSQIYSWTFCTSGRCRVREKCTPQTHVASSSDITVPLSMSDFNCTAFLKTAEKLQTDVMLGVFRLNPRIYERGPIKLNTLADNQGAVHLKGSWRAMPDQDCRLILAKIQDMSAWLDFDSSAAWELYEASADEKANYVECAHATPWSCLVHRAGLLPLHDGETAVLVEYLTTHARVLRYREFCTDMFLIRTRATIPPGGRLEHADVLPLARIHLRTAAAPPTFPSAPLLDEFASLRDRLANSISLGMKWRWGTEWDCGIWEMLMKSGATLGRRRVCAMVHNDPKYNGFIPLLIKDTVELQDILTRLPDAQAQSLASLLLPRQEYAVYSNVASAMSQLVDGILALALVHVSAGLIKAVGTFPTKDLEVVACVAANGFGRCG